MVVRTPALLAVIAVGGMLGAVGRLLVSAALAGLWVDGAAGTLAVNVLGALLIGVVGTRLSLEDPRWWLRPFVITGVLGGFTTFSAYALATAGLVDADPLLASAYLVGTVLAGLVAVRVGVAVGRWRP